MNFVNYIGVKMWTLIFPSDITSPSMLYAIAHYRDHNVWFEDIHLILVKSLIYFLYHMYRCHVVVKGESKWEKNDYSITILSENNLKKNTINCFLSSPPMSLKIAGNAFFFFQISFNFAWEIMGETWRDRNFDIWSVARSCEMKITEIFSDKI